MPSFIVTYRNTYGIPMAPLVIEAKNAMAAKCIARFEPGVAQIISVTDA